MSAIISFSICLTDIDKSKITEARNGKKYINLTASVNDETNQYGNNVSIYHSQSKEEREAKTDRIYLGNGKVVYENGGVSVANKQQPAQPQSNPGALPDGEESDLPF